VILPAQTFIATGLAILMQGAVPVFADIDYMTAILIQSQLKKELQTNQSYNSGTLGRISV